jgi:putative membrane protein
MNSAALFVPALLALAVAGCATDRPTAPARDGRATSTAAVGVAPVGVDDPSALDARSAGAASMMAMPPADAAATRDAPARLTSGQIVEVVHAANLGEIEQGELAQAKARDPRVKELATTMVKDHTAADARAMALTRKESLDLAPTPLSTSLERDADASTSSLKAKTGVDFDVAYVDVQVREHQAVLDTIDQKLDPVARDPDVKAFLGEIRPTIAMHLQRAQELQKAMQER